jgi:hypothetical protein
MVASFVIRAKAGIHIGCPWWIPRRAVMMDSRRRGNDGEVDWPGAPPSPVMLNLFQHLWPHRLPHEMLKQVQHDGGKEAWAA